MSPRAPLGPPHISPPSPDLVQTGISKYGKTTLFHLDTELWLSEHCLVGGCEVTEPTPPGPDGVRGGQCTRESGERKRLIGCDKKLSGGFILEEGMAVKHALCHPACRQGCGAGHEWEAL